MSSASSSEEEEGQRPLFGDPPNVKQREGLDNFPGVGGREGGREGGEVDDLEGV